MRTEGMHLMRLQADQIGVKKMKVKFEIELNIHEKLVYSLNTRSGENKISKQDKGIVHERIEKVMDVLGED
jgi:hypothetical protein